MACCCVINMRLTSNNSLSSAEFSKKLLGLLAFKLLVSQSWNFFYTRNVVSGQHRMMVEIRFMLQKLLVGFCYKMKLYYAY